MIDVYLDACATATALREMNKKAISSVQKNMALEIKTQKELFDAYRAELKRKDTSPACRVELLENMKDMSDGIIRTRREAAEFTDSSLQRTHQTDMAELLISGAMAVDFVLGLFIKFEIRAA